jgi:KaiC/GvpD/RAD55 family RecA-like ATPase
VKQLASSEMELKASREKRAQLEAALMEKEAETRHRQEELSATTKELELLRVKVLEVIEALGKKTIELEKFTGNNSDKM